MLSKQKRLSGRDITQLFSGGKTTGTPFFVAKYLPQNTTGCAIIAPKTIAKTAVLRTSLRRKWYASLKQASTTIPTGTGMYAFVLKKEAISAMPSERVQSFINFFQKNK